MTDDLISRKAAVDALEREKTYCTAFREGYTQTNVFEKYNAGLSDGIKALKNLPSAQPEIIRCKDCRKHNISVGYKEDCCALFEWRGVSYGHEHDYQYCCHAERRSRWMI